MSAYSCGAEARKVVNTLATSGSSRAAPTYASVASCSAGNPCPARSWTRSLNPPEVDRKSTRLNSSHGYISYAVFCLKKKKKQNYITRDEQQQRTRRTTDLTSHL